MERRDSPSVMIQEPEPEKSRQTARGENNETEIKEMDINPLLATKKGIIAVDARIRIEKEAKNK